MKIYYFLFEAIPTEQSEEYNSCGGAFINCWIKESSEQLADQRAKTSIESEGWKILNVEEYWVAEEDNYKNTDNWEYYEQAESDGEVYVFNLYPVEDTKKGVIH